MASLPWAQDWQCTVIRGTHDQARTGTGRDANFKALTAGLSGAPKLWDMMALHEAVRSQPLEQPEGILLRLLGF